MKKYLKRNQSIVIKMVLSALVGAAISYILLSGQAQSSPESSVASPLLHYAYVSGVDNSTGHLLETSVWTNQDGLTPNRVLLRYTSSSSWLILVAGPLPDEILLTSEGYDSVTVPISTVDGKKVLTSGDFLRTLKMRKSL